MGRGVEGRKVQHRRVPIAAEGHVLDLVLTYYHGPFPAPQRVGAIFFGYALALSVKSSPGTQHHVREGAAWGEDAKQNMSINQCVKYLRVFPETLSS